jgi:hypothetical protein
LPFDTPESSECSASDTPESSECSASSQRLQHRVKNSQQPEPGLSTLRVLTYKWRVRTNSWTEFSSALHGIFAYRKTKAQRLGKYQVKTMSKIENNFDSCTSPDLFLFFQPANELFRY